MSRKIHAFALMTVVVLVVAGCGGGSELLEQRRDELPGAVMLLEHLRNR